MPPEKESEIPEVPESELVVTFARSSGAGGQNVNKTSTKAFVRWHVDSSPAFTPDQKRLIAERLPNRINAEGFLFVSDDQERSQESNKANAIARIRSLVREALTPETPRVPTKPTRGSKERRLDEKAKLSRKKQERQGGGRGNRGFEY